MPVITGTWTSEARQVNTTRMCSESRRRAICRLDIILLDDTFTVKVFSSFLFDKKLLFDRIKVKGGRYGLAYYGLAHCRD